MMRGVFARLKALVIARTGHFYYHDKDDQLWERVSRRMKESGTDRLDSYLERLEAADDDSEWRALSSAITINETFFFRFSEQFDALRRSILPQLLKRHERDRKLRIWSAGCSNGAEPYSVAILLHDLLGDSIDGWRINIVGTDIDDEILEAAREARFGNWALRTLGEDERRRLFTHSGNSWRLKPRYRGMVRFEHHNLMAMTDRAAALQFEDFDLILCRNVLIYFQHDVATEVVSALADRLAPGGWLLVGHAEPNPAFADRIASVEVGAISAYRRPSGDEPAPDILSFPPLPALPAQHGGQQQADATSAKAAHTGIRKPQRPTPPRPVTPRPETADGQEKKAGTPGNPDLHDRDLRDRQIRDALSSGDLLQAIVLTDSAIAENPTDPMPHYQQALAAAALSDTARAEKGFRNALYLDSSFAMAHYLLGVHLIDHGRKADGMRCLRNAARAVAPLPRDAEIREGEGATARALQEAVRLRLDLEHAKGAAR